MRIPTGIALTFLLLPAWTATPGSEGQRLPHIVLINADDLGYGDLGCYGATKVRTPHIDALAEQGRLFTDAHSPSAVCSPSRYGLLTGRYPLRRNLWGPISTRQPLVIEPDRLTLGSLMKRAGYETACIGKWHLGFGDTSPTDWNKPLKPGPLELGFDYYFGIPLVNSGPPFVYVENHSVVGFDPADPFEYGKTSVTPRRPAKGGYNVIGGAKKAHELYVDENVGTTLREKAVSWIRQKDGQTPFFLYLATTNIHHPFTPAPRFNGSGKCGRYGDFIHELDWIVGGIMEALADGGFEKNTLVIFTSDNGGMLNHGGQDAWKAGHRLNGELLGFKFGAWEGGHRIPFIARWPGRIPAGTRSDHLLSQVDLLATFAAIIGQRLGKGQGEDSLNQLPILTGDPEKPVREKLVISPNCPSHLLLRKGRWVYIPGRDSGGFQGTKIGDHLLAGAASSKLTGDRNSDFTETGTIRKDAPPAQLYDLQADLRQTTNLYEKHPETVRELDAILGEHRKNIGPYKITGWINKRNWKRPAGKTK